MSVLDHGARTKVIASEGLLARDVSDGTETRSPAAVIAVAQEGTFDLVLVALRRDQLHSAAIPLSAVNGHPLILFLGNNPAGHSDLPAGPDAAVSIGFPGLGGAMVGDVANYIRISQQPTALEATGDPRLADVAAAPHSRGFAVTADTGDERLAAVSRGIRRLRRGSALPLRDERTPARERAV